MCQQLESIVLILQFMLSRLKTQIPPKKIRSLACTLLGAKALLKLPEFIQTQYRPLMEEPLLIIEQLLIDLKVSHQY